MSALERSAVAETFIAAYNCRDMAALLELYSPNAEHEDIAQGRTKAGAETIVGGLQKFLEWFPDASWLPVTTIAGDGPGIAIVYVLSATLAKPMGPIEPRGQSISLRGVLVLRMEHGKISRSEDYWDATTFQRQMTTITPEEKQ